MKKIFKKSLALMVSAALCLTAFVGCLTVNAEETAPTNTATLTVGSKEITKGTTTVTVPVTLQANDSTEIAAARFSLVIDSSVFTFTDVIDNCVVVPEGAKYDVSVSTTDGSYPSPKSGNTYIFLVEATKDGSGEDIATVASATFDLVLTVDAAAAAATYAFAGYEGEDPKVAILEACDLGTATNVNQQLVYGPENEVVITPTFGSVTIKAAHTHSYTELKYDETNHWYECPDDGEKDGLEAHTYGEWVVDEAASTTKEGSKHRDCSVCLYRDTAVIPVIPCDHANATYDYSVVDGNCITKKVCPDCGNEETITTVANTTTDVKKSPVTAEGLAINFRTVASAVADYSDIYGVFTKDLYTGNGISGTDVENIVAKDETVSKVDYKTCKYTGIASYEMTSNIHVSIYGKDSDGNVILLRDLDYKFVDYLNTNYTRFTGNLRNALGRLADYGTYNQLMNTYHVDALPSDTMPDDLVAELPTTFENTTVSEGGIKIYKAPKVGNSVTINYRLLKTDVAAYDDFSLQISYIDAYNKPQVATASLSAGDFTTFTSSGKEYWSYEFKNLVAAKINDILDVKLVSGEVELGTTSYGIEAYAETQYNRYKDSTNDFYYYFAKACQSVVAYGRAMAALYS